MENRELVFALIEAASKITRKLDGSLSGIKGISFSEYQLLSGIRAQPSGSSTRVDLANLVGLTPSGVTRALKPLEKLGFVETIKDGRDARRALATLTPAGVELVTDASGVIDDTLNQVADVSDLSDEEREHFIALLRGLTHG